MLREIVTELHLLTFRGPRGLEALEAALSVTLAVLAALAAHSDTPWWAGISALQVTRASLALFVSQRLPFCLSLFVVACVGYFGFAISRFSYGWLIGAVTANLVMLTGFT